MLAEVVRKVDDLCGLGVVVADVIRGLAALVDSDIDVVGHGDGLQLEVVGPDAVSAHLGDIVVKALLVVDKEAVVALVRLEVVAGALAQLHVVVLGAVQLVRHGAEEAVAVVADIADAQAGRVERAREGVQVELLGLGRRRRARGAGSALPPPHDALLAAGTHGSEGGRGRQCGRAEGLTGRPGGADRGFRREERAASESEV